ncbi:MAG: permease [Candidatus Heimdallarchaeaceae archaeon]
MASTFWIFVLEMLKGGLFSLADYLSFHVLLCLVPAFFIAGAMMVFIPKETIMKYLGKDAKKIVAYPAAAIGGLLLAVCSCTVLPLFAGIKKKGAGLGPAITFLFSAPAVNILALTYTGSLIGADIAIARAILALVFAILIGVIMELLFPEKKKESLKVSSNKDMKQKGEKSSTEASMQVEEYIEDETKETNNSLEKNNLFSWKTTLNAFLGGSGVVFGILILTLDKELLLEMGVQKGYIVQTILWGVGLSFLIILLFTSKNSAMNLFLLLIYALFTGTSQISYFNYDLLIFKLTVSSAVTNMIAKALLTLIITVIIVIFSKKSIENEDVKEWMRETWSFVKSIIPLIIVGVFIAGMLQVLIPENWIETVVGNNSVLGNLIGVLFGVFMYFPTLMEVPIAKMFLNLGMSRGVLLAYLLADPELSIQSILVTRKYLGNKKNLIYVLLVIIFTVIAGLLFGLLISHEPVTWI